MQFKYHLLCLPILLTLVCCKSEPAGNPSIQAFPVEQKSRVVLDYDTTGWTVLRLVDSTIILDLKYATTDNFVKEKMYECGRCFLRSAVAKQILLAQKKLQKQGFRLKIFDCYRPKPIQEKLWKKVPNPNYVTPPWKGSMHNKGAAVDLTIVDSNGQELDMGSPYDFFGPAAHHTYTGHSKTVNENRKLLKDLMASVELRPIRTEWWHYSYQKQAYPVSEMLWVCPD